MFIRKAGQSEETWMSASDLMTVLMVLFLLIAVFYNILESKKAKVITKRATDIIKIEEDLCKEIKSNFSTLIETKKISVICDPITITFRDPAFKFKTGDSTVPEAFKDILNKFFPILIEIIHSKAKYKITVDELRIEGHTSSEWGAGVNKLEGIDSFKKNMEISQDRARSVLDYCLSLPPIAEDTTMREQYLARRKWAFRTLTANGLSFAKFIRFKDHSEDRTASRRVEFKLLTNTRDVIKDIREAKKINKNIEPRLGLQ